MASKYQEDWKKMNKIKSFLPSSPTVAAAPQQQEPAGRRPLQFDAVCTTSTLGLKLSLVNNKDITVKHITPTAPNAHLIKVGDFVVGINGKRLLSILRR